jgi:hypothetical protein
MTPGQEIANAIDRLPNGSCYWRHVRARLTRLARRDPHAFWSKYLDVTNQPDEDYAADLREMLAENPNQTFGELKEILRRRYAVKQ